MDRVQSHIPTEVYLEFLGRTIEINWNYHAILMTGIWLILVPICIVWLRYFKPEPRPHGIRDQIKILSRDWVWFNAHKYGLYLAVVLSLGGLLVAVTVSQGISWTMHSIFGLATIVLGCFLALSALLRGTHGGRYYYNADPDDPSTWKGDHYEMTPRRRWFEAFHKTAGYLACFFAFGAVGSGLMQYPMPALLGVVLATILVLFVLCIRLEFKGRAYDNYLSCFGTDPDNPGNLKPE
jgi:hypothetical protein